MLKIPTIIILAIILSVSTYKVVSQTKKETNTQKTVKKEYPITDSTAVISLRDIQQFNIFLKDAASFNQYSKLSPETTLTELWNWKVKQLSTAKILPDSTKK